MVWKFFTGKQLKPQLKLELKPNELHRNSKNPKFGIVWLQEHLRRIFGPSGIPPAPRAILNDMVGHLGHLSPPDPTSA